MWKTATILGIGVVLCMPWQKACAEQVYVKYRGLLNLEAFQCKWESRSSLVERICYDAKQRYLVVSLKGTYYHYCEIPSSVVTEWKEAASMGRYYLSEIKGRYDCRLARVPEYRR